jgi:hypothetical protein
MKPGAQRVVDLTEGLQDFYVLAGTGLIFVGRDDWPNLLAGAGLDEGSTVRLGRRHGDSYYEGLDIYDAFRARHGSGFNLDFLGVLAGSLILTVGDAAIREHVQDKSEVMQFLRHARHAVAHGNRFNLSTGEPKMPAVLRRATEQGGDLEIDASLNGDEFLLQFMSTGDVMDLLDAVKAHVSTAT